MSMLWLFGLFLLKHALLAHVVDFGYSLARSNGRRRWRTGLACHTLLELSVSYLFLLNSPPLSKVIPFLGMETLALVGSAMLERKARLRELLKTHLTAECYVAATYLGLTIVWALTC